ncbi:L-ascorbate metabolism protein UlaG (beta-lactamase superfamily) [Bradyrhizobium sp. RT6a]|uniref:MBL fold metallo-hydrolase n=1 Tax=Bradyrhizobium sp. RT6a TaxID=3156381 RepID=UPI003395D753
MQASTDPGRLACNHRQLAILHQIQAVPGADLADPRSRSDKTTLSFPEAIAMSDSVCNVRYHGVAAYEIVAADGRRILLDPFFAGNPASLVKAEDFERVDLILVTHAARDHLGDTPAIAKLTGATVLCGNEVQAYLRAMDVPASQIRPTAWGMRLEIAGFEIQTLECRHCSGATMPDGSFVSGIPLAFIIELGAGVRWYHPGDTSLFSDMRLQGELYQPTIGSLGIANPSGIADPRPGRKLTTDLSPREGVLAAQWLGLKTVLPCHYTDPDDPLVHQFQRCLADAKAAGESVPESLVLAPGDWISLDASGCIRRREKA